MPAPRPFGLAQLAPKTPVNLALVPVPCTKRGLGMPNRAAILTALILDRPMCEPCLSEKSGLGSADISALLGVIRTALKLHEGPGRCRTCGETAAEVLALERPELSLLSRSGTR